MKYTPEQQLAIDCIDKNLQIIACAGAGKTQVISQRIVNILKQDDVEAKNIIATNKQANLLNILLASLPFFYIIINNTYYFQEVYH